MPVDLEFLHTFVYTYVSMYVLYVVFRNSLWTKTFAKCNTVEAFFFPPPATDTQRNWWDGMGVVFAIEVDVGMLEGCGVQCSE